MKQALIILGFIFFLVHNSNAQVLEKEEAEVFTEVETMPEFPGGMASLNKYIANNVKYPEEELDNSNMGKVIVTFIIDDYGAVRNVTVGKSSGYELLDKEAVRVVKSMPHWKPGTKNGKNVNVRFSLPIIFQIQ